jgi:hypothetical protein
MDVSVFPLAVSAASFFCVATILLFFSVITSSFLPVAKDCLNIVPAALLRSTAVLKGPRSSYLVGLFCIAQGICNHQVRVQY